MGRLPDEVDPNRPDDSGRFGKLLFKLFETVDSHGDKQIAIQLDAMKRIGTGYYDVETMRCDLDRLEAVARHGQELKSQLDRGIRVDDRSDSQSQLSVMHHGTWTAYFYEKTDDTGERKLLVDINHEFENQSGQKRSQFITCEFDGIAEVAERGVMLEEALGHEKRWNAIVKADALAEKEGDVRVHVVKWEKDADIARTFAEKNREMGYGVYTERFRRAKEVENYSFDCPESYLPALGADIRYLKAERGRTNPGLMLGVWHQDGTEPSFGMQVSVLNTGRDSTSREPTPYRVVPRGIKSPEGEGEKSIHVILDVSVVSGKQILTIREAIRGSEGEAKKRFQQLKSPAVEYGRSLEHKPAREPLKERETGLKLSEEKLPEIVRRERRH